MILLRLFFEFCKVGLFSVGGGLATIPFLTDMGIRTGWFTPAQLTDMIAISESTPGPIGVNMATYAGYTTAGIPGGIVATLGLVFPSIIIILLISGFLQKYRESRIVDAVFYGLRAASVALITEALLQVASIALMNHTAARHSADILLAGDHTLHSGIHMCKIYTAKENAPYSFHCSVSCYRHRTWHVGKLLLRRIRYQNIRKPGSLKIPVLFCPYTGCIFYVTTLLSPLSH